MIIGKTKGFIRGKALSVEGHTHSEYAATSHTHDDRYYTESEVNSLLAGKAASSHSHDASNITSGALAVSRGGTGQTNTSPDPSLYGIRAIAAGTGDLAAGSTGLTTGVIYLVYE